MGTYDTRGGTPRHDPAFDLDPVIYPEEEQVLGLLEEAGVQADTCEHVVRIVGGLAARAAQLEAAADEAPQLRMRTYRCWLRSAPGMWAQYDGFVDVVASHDEQVFERAVQQLARSSFRDRPSLSHWRLERIECLPEGRS